LTLKKRFVGGIVFTVFSACLVFAEQKGVITGDAG